MEKRNCASCSVEFTRAKEWIEWANQGFSFYKMKIKYCDSCHRQKTQEAFAQLPKVLGILAK